MKNNTSSNFDASEFVSPWVRKEELKSGSKKFTVQAVSETIFEARGDRAAQRVLVLELDSNRTYSLSTKADLKTMIDAYGQKTGKWVGRQITLYFDKDVMFGSDQVGGVRVRLPKGNGKTGRPAAATLPTSA